MIVRITVWPVGVAILAWLFTPCVEHFEYIRFGRKFGRDYETCLVARLAVSVAQSKRVAGKFTTKTSIVKWLKWTHYER
jgi:hypothetical protein